MAVVNERAVVSVFNMLERTAIQLPKVLGGLTFDQQIQKLFANGEQGFFYDPNDLSTMFQDAAGTVPVTGAGQPVGLIRDKSGRNNHARQTASASRPILRQNAITGAYYLEFDGSDDFLQTNNIDFTATDKVSLFTGIRRLSDSALGVVVETGTNYSIPTGGFALFAPSVDFGHYIGFGVSGGSVFYNQGFSVYAPPLGSVTSLCLDLSATDRPTQVKFNIDGVGKVIGVGSAATGKFANTPIFIGRRSGKTLPFAGHIYGLIGIGKLTSDDETATIEKELAKRVGVTL